MYIVEEDRLPDRLIETTAFGTLAEAKAYFTVANSKADAYITRLYKLIKTCCADSNINFTR